MAKARTPKRDITLEILEALISGDKVKPRLVDINSVTENPDNPQKISDKDFEDLKTSIKDFPEMMAFRPVIIDANGMALAGNKRRRACYALGWTKIPVIDASDLPDKLLKQLIIKDNVQAGRWDKKKLREEWKMPDLAKWGVKVDEIVKKAKQATESLTKPQGKYFVQVSCSNARQQKKTYNDLVGKGFECTMVNKADDGNAI